MGFPPADALREVPPRPKASATSSGIVCSERRRLAQNALLALAFAQGGRVEASSSMRLPTTGAPRGLKSPQVSSSSNSSMSSSPSRPGGSEERPLAARAAGPRRRPTRRRQPGRPAAAAKAMAENARGAQGMALAEAAPALDATPSASGATGVNGAGRLLLLALGAASLALAACSSPRASPPRKATSTRGRLMASYEAPG